MSTIVLKRVRVPRPHVPEHGVQVDQSDRVQLRGQ